MRRRINFANVVATLALLFSMSGGAFAASHYLISSTKQVSPKVLKKLRGKTGKRGPAGSTGAEGAAGKTGATGSTGATGATGVTGNQGVPGEEGPEGAEGPIGPSAAYEEKSLTSSNLFTKAKTISVVVPAGSYDITAKAQEQNPEVINTGTVTCELKPEGEAALDSMVSALAAKGEATAVLHSGFEKGSGTATILFTCSETAGSSKEVLLIHPTLSAIKVGALH
jgi:Collagen triple helix repeat (20 copies)